MVFSEKFFLNIGTFLNKNKDVVAICNQLSGHSQEIGWLKAMSNTDLPLNDSNKKGELDIC